MRLSVLPKLLLLGLLFVAIQVPARIERYAERWLVRLADLGEGSTFVVGLGFFSCASIAYADLVTFGPVRELLDGATHLSGVAEAVVFAHALLAVSLMTAFAIVATVGSSWGRKSRREFATALAFVPPLAFSVGVMAVAGGL